jgi:hypothetical protein
MTSPSPAPLPPAPPPPPEPDRVDSAFRNGTLAATGIVAAFSLGFLTRWAGVAGTWSATDFVSLVVILAGIVCQIRALYLLLDYESLELANHRRAIRIFKIGLGLTAAGVVLAVFADVAGMGGIVMRW